jgi:hypothetical protein
MKIFYSFMFILLFASTYAQIDFESYFHDKSFRFDYTLAGNSKKVYAFENKYKEEPYWGGSKTNLIDKFNFGDFRILITDSTSNKLIYSRGYSTLFYEWLDTEEANNTSKSYYESVSFPYPKNTFRITIQMRQKNTEFFTLFETIINPNHYFVIKDKQERFSFERIKYSGNHHTKLDIVIIPDGYTKDEAEKFIKDCHRFKNYFFEVEPFKSNKEKVNFWAVNAYSEESGTDIPGQNIWKNTILNSHFYTFGSERYLTTSDIETLRDIAAYVPYDQIYILVNTKKYGGGGIYNYYNLCSADHPQSEQVFTHEFGHAFAALADEYDYGFEKASDLYDMNVEPWQVNITNLVDFESKWKSMLSEDTQIPTEANDENINKIGVYQGAGYVKEGIYRPMQDCKMRSNNTNEFCPVCHKAIFDLLLFYTE